MINKLPHEFFSCVLLLESHEKTSYMDSKTLEGKILTNQNGFANVFYHQHCCIVFWYLVRQLSLSIIASRDQQGLYGMQLFCISFACFETYFLDFTNITDSVFSGGGGWGEW